jgi:hypothetical protein
MDRLNQKEETVDGSAEEVVSQDGNNDHIDEEAIAEELKLEHFANCFDTDQHDDSNIKRMHRIAFVQQCYGDPDEQGKFRVPRNSKAFPSEKYQDYVDIVDNWNKGAKQVKMKFRRTYNGPHGAHTIAKFFGSTGVWQRKSILDAAENWRKSWRDCLSPYMCL